MLAFFSFYILLLYHPYLLMMMIKFNLFLFLFVSPSTVLSSTTVSIPLSWIIVLTSLPLCVESYSKVLCFPFFCYSVKSFYFFFLLHIRNSEVRLCTSLYFTKFTIYILKIKHSAYNNPLAPLSFLDSWYCKVDYSSYLHLFTIFLVFTSI